MPLTGKTLITFDAAGTLFHPHPSVGAIYQEIAQQHGLNYGQDDLNRGFVRGFSRISKDESILDGERRERSFWKNVVRVSIEEFDEQPKDFEALFDDMWETFSHGDRWRTSDGARETLQTLRKRGYEIALLTNWDSRVRRVLQENGFHDLFDHLFISSEIGHEKPDREIFLHVEKATGHPPEKILHVGDSIKHDIAGAEAAGWTSILIGNESPPESIKAIRQLSELI